MELKFSSIDEVKEFVSQLKGTRGKKGDGDDAPTTLAPAPIPVPTTAATHFAPQPNVSTGFTPTAAFPGAASAIAPEVAALVQRINMSIDGAINGGQSAEACVSWFRQRIGTEAASATLDQIKNQLLAKLSVAHLQEIAKLMGA